jgi:tetratricopeptide (TPR) repeat protein
VSANTRSFQLDDVRADGWFERLGEGSTAFEQLCGVLGRKFVAFAVVAGVRITAVTVDARVPEASTVEFTLGNEGPAQRLPLGEFRRRLVAMLLAEDAPAQPLPERPGSEELSAFIGFRWVLLSPIFGIQLRELRVAGDAAQVVVGLGGSVHELSLEELREVIRDRIRAELQRVRSPSRLAIDLNRVPEALRAAASGDHEQVIELLGSWPGPLSLLLRTAEGQSLSAEVKARLAQALGVLGSAYVAVGHIEWGQDALRLAIQWGHDTPVGADLYRRLGEAHLGCERYGEAIGLFRRAIQLGAPKREVLPHLATAFAARHRHLAALVCAEEAIREGAPESSVREARDEAIGALGERWWRFKQYLAG